MNEKDNINEINDVNINNNTDMLQVQVRKNPDTQTKERTKRRKSTKTSKRKIEPKKSNEITNDTPLDTENRLEIKDLPTTSTNIDEFAENNNKDS